jgi:hypothetical protein
VVGLAISGAGGTDGSFDAGDTLTVSFSPDTNLANLGRGILTKQQVDRIITFSQNLGANYTGRWTDAKTLVVTCVDPTGAAPPLRSVVTAT